MKARKNLGEKAVLIMAILLTAVVQTYAIPIDINIYDDKTIQNGEEYGIVNIYDSPPDQTIVDMLGGSIAECHIYDNAILNYESGEIVYTVCHENSTVNVHSNYTSGFQLEDNSKVFLYNGDSEFQIYYYYGADNAQVHFYGYNLIYTPPSPVSPGIVDGYWESNLGFHVTIRCDAYVTPTVILHEIPEPLTILLFTFGGLMLGRTR